MTSLDRTPEICGICGRRRDEPHPFRHLFAASGDPSLPDKPKSSTPTQGRRVTYAGDLPLRHLLMKKGLITAQELEEANQAVQAMLRGTGAADQSG